MVIWVWILYHVSRTQIENLSDEVRELNREFATQGNRHVVRNSAFSLLDRILQSRAAIQ